MPPNPPLRLKLGQGPAQMIARGAQHFAQLAFGRHTVIVPVSGVVDQIAQSLREVARFAHRFTQFGDWLIDRSNKSAKNQ